jgi:hypothetical protein
MANEVRIFDREGNLVRTVQPVFEANPKQTRKFLAHPCPGCGEKTTKKAYCNICLRDREEKKTRPDEER